MTKRVQFQFSFLLVLIWYMSPLPVRHFLSAFFFGFLDIFLIGLQAAGHGGN